jgi:hypothetical protein
MILQTLCEQCLLAIKRSQTCNNLCLLLCQPYSSFGSIKSEPIASPRPTHHDPANLTRAKHRRYQAQRNPQNLCMLLRQPYSSFDAVESEPIAVGNVPPALRRLTKVHAS